MFPIITFGLAETFAGSVRPRIGDVLVMAMK
jgi:hypothetical protein